MLDFIIDVIVNTFEFTIDIFKILFCLGISLAGVGGVFYLMCSLNALWPMILLVPTIALGYSFCYNMLF
jgi:hypothetical protein